jgi:RimJ/RimL family protein N-acetyltransferase
VLPERRRSLLESALSRQLSLFADAPLHDRRRARPRVSAAPAAPPLSTAALVERAPRRLETPRLRLEWPRAEHAAPVRDSINASLPTLRFVKWGQRPFDDDDARRFCEADAARVAAGECLIYFAFERDGGRFVGNLDLHTFDFDVPRCQIGYVGDSRLAGRGLMHEAATAVLELAFRLGFERVEAWCDLRNARSIHFAQALGLQYEGLMRGVERDPQGTLCDQVLLARLRTDEPPTAR